LTGTLEGNSTIRSKPLLELKGTPLMKEKDFIKGGWNIIKLDPSFHLNQLVKFLSVESTKS
jgi:hypothetical protein